MSAPAQSGQHRTFVSMKIPAYRTLWWGGAFSFMGVQMQFLLRGLLAWDLTEREGALGVVFLVFGLAMLVFTPLGGVAADRMQKRRLLMMGQAVLTAVSVLMGIAVVTNNAQFWMLLVASIAQGAMFGFIGPARVSFTVELVGRELLGNAISLSMLSMSSTRVFAPALAGMLAGVALFGIGGAYLVAGIFSVISFVLVFRLPASAPSSRLKRSPFADIADGVRYVAGHGPLRRLILSSTVVIMFGFNYVAFSPALVEGIYGLGDREVGFISTASSIGAVGVSAFVARRADSPSVARMIFVSGLVFGLGVIALGAAPTYWSALLVVVVIGGATTGYQALTSSVAMRTADSDQQGRVQSLMQLSFAAFGIAALPLGLLAEAIGLRQTFAVMGVVAASAVLFYALAERRAAQVGNR